MHRLVRQFLLETAVGEGYCPQELENRFMEITLAWTAGESSELRQTLSAANYQNLHREWRHIERAWWLAVKQPCYELLESCWDILFYFEARGIWGQGDAFFEATRQQIPPDNRYMHARLDEAQALMAGRVYDMQRSVRLAQRSLETLEDLGVDLEQSEAGSYARIILYLAEYAFKQSAFPEEEKQMLRTVASGYLASFAEVAIMMFDAATYCAQEDFESATLVYQEMLKMNGSDTYVNANLLCFLGLSLNGQGNVEAAREQFQLALKRGLKGGYSTAVVSATYELQHLGKNDALSQRFREALEDLALQMGSRRTVGLVAISNAIYYLNLGLFMKGSRLMRIAVGLLWNEVNTAERGRILATIAQAYIAFGLIKTAPQVMSLVAPKLLDPA